MTMKLTIGKLARQAGVHVETVRFYERKGLIPQPPRAEGYRVYSLDTLNRLRFIKSAKGLGFSLKEIAEILCLMDHQVLDCGDVEAMANRKLAEIEEKMRRLQAMQRALLQLKQDCLDGQPRSTCLIEDFYESPVQTHE